MNGHAAEPSGFEGVVHVVHRGKGGLLRATVKKHETTLFVIHFQGDPREWLSERVMRLFFVHCDKVFIAVDHFILAAHWSKHRAHASMSYNTKSHDFALPFQNEAHL